MSIGHLSTHNFVNIPRLLLILSTTFLPISFSQTGAEIREYMKENNSSFIDTISGLDIGYYEAIEELGFADAFEIPSLGFNFTSCISPSVQFNGTAEEVGLRQAPLESFLKLRLRNDIQGLEFCDSSSGGLTQGGLKLILTVWTVGDSYPVAYHLDFSSFVVFAPNGFNNPFEASYLGYANPEALEGEIETAIEEAIQIMGVSYLKGVGEW